MPQGLSTLATHTCYVCYAAVLLFNIPMYAFLPGIVQYIEDRRCDAMNMQGDCDNDDVNASAASYMNWTFIGPCNIPNAVVALALGTLSDRLGRRPLMLLCTTTQCIGSLGAALVVYFRLNIWWFAPFFFVNGLGGASWVFVVLVMASLGDIATNAVHRSALFAHVMGLFFFCSAAGPLLGGMLHSYVGELFSGLEGGDYQAVFGLFFVTNILLVLLILLGFRETHPALPTEKSIPVMSVKSLLIDPTIEPIKLVYRSPKLRLMAAIYSFCYFGFADRSSLLSLYATKEPFKMSHTTLGWFLSAQGLARAVAVFGVLKGLLKLGRYWFGDDRSGLLLSLMSAARVGMSFAVTFTACFGLARDDVTLFILAAIEGLDAMWDSSLRVLFSELGSDESAGEGQVLGVIGFLQVTIGCVAPLLYQEIYSATVHWCSYFTFLLTAGVTAIGFILSFSMSVTSEYHQLKDVLHASEEHLVDCSNQGSAHVRDAQNRCEGFEHECTKVTPIKA